MRIKSEESNIDSRIIICMRWWMKYIVKILDKSLKLILIWSIMRLLGWYQARSRIFLVVWQIPCWADNITLQIVFFWGISQTIFHTSASYKKSIEYCTLKFQRRNGPRCLFFSLFPQWSRRQVWKYVQLAACDHHQGQKQCGWIIPGT